MMVRELLYFLLLKKVPSDVKRINYFSISINDKIFI